MKFQTDLTKKVQRPVDVYLRVIKELEHFTHCDCTPEQEEDKTTKAEKVWRRDPQNKLQCKSVQLSH